MANKIFVILLLTLFSYVTAQQTKNPYVNEAVKTSLSKYLIECYNDTEIVVKDNKLPMTLETFLDIIRKVEDSSYYESFSQLSTSILQRFRQDGVIRAADVKPGQNMDGVLIYSPRSWTNDKFKIIMRDTLNGDPAKFHNETLTRLERCSLHSLLSSSIEIWKRGDEEAVCKSIGKYQRRFRRGLRKRATKPDDEVEIIDDKSLSNPTGALKSPNTETERIGNLNMPKSDCPVETGVMKTRWGPVSVGPLLAGIVAGANPQKIPVSDITKGTPDIKLDDIDNLWAATLAGDLAEAALYVDEDDATDGRISIGCSGNFNSTDLPHWYFLERNTKLFMTDAEIRGGLDGLNIGRVLQGGFGRQQSKLKLSQIIDMYYSNVGLPTGGTERVRACSRRSNFTKLETEMKAQTHSFAYVLYENVRLKYTITENKMMELADKAVDALIPYVPSHLNDPECDKTYDRQDTTKERSEFPTNLILAVDFTFPRNQIQSYLMRIINQMNINQYTGNYTIVNAADGTIVVNSTSVYYQFIQILTAEVYDKLQKGFDYDKTIRAIEEVAKWYMERERTDGLAGGRSLIGLIITQAEAKPTDYIRKRVRDIINVFVPDLRFFVLTTASTTGYENVVKDTTKDIVVIANIDDIAKITDRMKEVPTRFTNPQCGANWRSSGSVVNPLKQFILPQHITIYRIHPNYFFHGGNIKISSLDTNVFTVCYSRSNIQPSSANQTGQTDATCDTTSGKEITISLSNACADKSFIHDCPALYFSVEAPKESGTNKNGCTDDGCRFPAEMSYTITASGLGCDSGAATLVLNVFLIIVMFTLLKINT